MDQFNVKVLNHNHINPMIGIINITPPKVPPKVLPKVLPKVPPKVLPKVLPKVPPKVLPKVPPIRLHFHQHQHFHVGHHRAMRLIHRVVLYPPHPPHFRPYG